MINADSGRGAVTDLLLLLSRVSFTGNERQRAGELCQVLSDWPAFTELSVKHGVAALVWQNIVDLQLDSLVSASECQILETSWLRTIARVAYITSTAKEIISTLEGAGIKVLLLKGLALEHSVYGSRGVRQMSDADLLVAPGDALRARDIILSLGFASRQLKSPLYRKIILDLGDHLPDMYRGGVSVDLHHRLFGPLATELTAQALRLSYKVTAGGKTYNVLPPRIAILSMVRHLQKHHNKGEFQMRLYCDIYLLLKQHFENVICDELLNEAWEAGVLNELKELLYIMKIVYGLDVPDKFIMGLNINQDILIRFYNNLVNPGHSEPLDPRELYKMNLQSITGLKHKIIFIVGDIFPSISFMKKRYDCHSVMGCLLRYPHRFGKLARVLYALLRS